MTQLTFAAGLRVAPSPKRGMQNLELLDERGATIAVAQLNAETAASVITQLIAAFYPSGPTIIGVDHAAGPDLHWPPEGNAP